MYTGRTALSGAPASAAHEALVRLARGGAGLMAVTALVAGCSSGGPVNYGTPTPVSTSALAQLSASDLLSRARVAVLAAGSVHVVGGTPSGTASPSAAPIVTAPAASPSAGGSAQGNLSMDLRLHTNGDGDGTLVWNGQNIQMVSKSGSTYMHAAPSFWDAVGQQGASAAVNDRWVKIVSSDPVLGSFTQFLDLTSLTTQVVAADTGSPRIIGGQQYHGRPVTAVAVPQDGGDATVYVMDDGGPPYLAGVSENISGSLISLEFDGYGTEPPPIAPPPSDVVADSSVLNLNS